MAWVYLSLLAPLVLTAVVFIDKYVVTARVKDPLGLALYGALTAVVFGTIVWLFTGFPYPGQSNSLLILGAGFLSMFGTLLYFLALAKNQTSYTVALIQVTPVFVLILASVILNETLQPAQLIGFTIIFLATIGLSIEQKANTRFKVNRSLYTILASDALFAVATILIKFTSHLTSFSTILIYESWGTALAGLVLVVGVAPLRRAFITSLKASGISTLGIMFGNEGLYVLSKALTFLAIILGPVALVAVLSGTQIFYGLLFGVILTWLMPGVFDEATSKPVLAQKIALSLVLFCGIWLASRS